MAVEGAVDYLRYRVLNPNTGAVVIADLPHPHQSTWTVRAIQAGMPGSTTLGDFTIPLFGPQSDQFYAAKPLYDLLAAGQKIEGYLGDVGTGTPRVTGVIVKVTKALGKGWQISGSDTLWWLQQSQLFDGEKFPPGTSDDLVAIFLGTREIVFDGRPSGTNGTWSTTTADPQFGLPAVLSTDTTHTNTYALPATNYSVSSEYNWPSGATLARASSVSAWGTAVSGTSTTLGASFGLTWLRTQANDTGYMCRAVVRQTGVGTGVYAVDVELYRAVGGVYTLSVSVANLFTNLSSNVFPFHITACLFNFGTQQHGMRVLLNGKVALEAFETHANLVNTSGRVGLYAAADTSAGAAPTTYFNNLRFESRTGSTTLAGFPTTWGVDRFTAGTISTGNSTHGFWDSQGQTHLDMLVLAATLDGFDIKKTPQAGYKSDTIDYGSGLGTDRSGSVVFEEAVNVVPDGTQGGPVADLYSTTTRVNAMPGSDVGGSVTIPTVGNGEGVGGNPGTGGDIVLADTVSDMGFTTASWFLSYAVAAANRKASPNSAVQVEAVRDPAWCNLLSELDWVTVHLPTLGINRQRQRVIGYTFKEGAPTQLYYLNQYPAHALVQAQVQRLARSVEWVTHS